MLTVCCFVKISDGLVSCHYVLKNSLRTVKVPTKHENTNSVGDMYNTKEFHES